MLASLPAQSAYRNLQLYTFSCVLFITFQPTSEWTHHCAHYNRVIRSRFWMDSCPVFPHLKIRQPGPPWLLPAGAGFPRVTFTWWLIKSHSFLCFKGKEVGKLWGSQKHHQFWEATPLLLICFMPDTEQSKGSPAEQGQALFPGIIYSWKKTSLNLYCLLLLLLEVASTLSPSTGYPHSEPWLCTSWPVICLQGGKG